MIAEICVHDSPRSEPKTILNTMRNWLNGEPVWSHEEILQQWGQEFMMYRNAWAENIHIFPSLERSLELLKLRSKAIKEFGFAIPCRELLDVLKQHQPIIEIGAGSGYFTTLMRKHGVEVLGTDPGIGSFGFSFGCHDNQQLVMQGKTAIRRYRGRTVFCSWPTLDHTWFRQAMRAMRIGQKLIVIEEDSCAEQSTWDYREATFKPLADVPLPAWNHMNDRASVWVKQHEPRRPQCGINT